MTPLGEKGLMRWHDQHISRGWPGCLQIEDACPCPQEPCGHVALDHVVPECEQHTANQTMRNGHRADLCPGERTDAA